MAARTPTSSTKRKRKANTWKDIDQSVKPKAMSSASERRVWMGRAKLFGGVLFVGAVLAAALHFAPQIEGGPEMITKAGESLPVATIDVHTDGNLERDYLLRTLDVPEDANLLSVDLDEMKRRLESIGQVESAVVSRRFPDALEVTVEERTPIMRLLVQRSNGETLNLFVDGDGVVFEADRLDPRISRRLPFLFGVNLAKEEEGFSDVGDIEPLADLLSEAQAVAPHIYSSWRIMSLEKEDRLIAKGKFVKEVVFDRNSDFRDQLAKLDYILDYHRGNGSGPLKRIDLTLGDQVPVTL
ncbi:cell division protein FtsQ/DivIB [Pelagicoccus mobilis]|uniref:FtsQ-type POTRA domain-containing protein n=1 Tax=Pelagicoccus mobilis TaxID=415221 RepID=A0A934VKE2_9BACT|nr:FtsQ-type POTRA domain-containing protein [Pelagicoccus mobilis]MBK1876576.1 FtsQ-type POTRA domain-containing protein [Pelagicoccus mobilis]